MANAQPKTARRRFASRLSDVAPFRAVGLVTRAWELMMQGLPVIHMEIGEPDFPTPEPVIRKLTRMLKYGVVGYSPIFGQQSLRVAIAEHYERRYGISISPERVVVAPGATGAMLLALAAILNPGDHVLVTDPGYPCHNNQIRLMQGEPVAVPVDASTAYKLTADLIDRHWTPRTVGVILVSPSNPAGTVIAPGELKAIAGVVRERGGIVFSDEIYHGLTYGDRTASVLEMDDDCFVVNSFSKYFGMTGFRLGWLIVPAVYLEPLGRLATHLFLGSSTPAQFAALAAFEPDTLALLDARVDEFRRRRDLLVPALRELGFRVPVTPEGAFYVHADCTALSHDSAALAADLLEHAAVAVIPGAEFGAHQASTHLRFAYATSRDNIEAAIGAMHRHLQRRRWPAASMAVAGTTDIP